MIRPLGEPDREPIQRWMRMVMQVTGWSAAQWADKARTSPSNITRFLNRNDASIPSMRTMAKLAKAAPIKPPDIAANAIAAESAEAAPGRNAEDDLRGTAVAEYDVYASAGGGSIVEQENVVAEWRFPTEWLRVELGYRARNLAIITVIGDSMAGTIDDGDKVVVDLGHRAPSPPGIYIVHDGIAQVAKRLEYIEGSAPPRVRIMSDNRRYDPYERTLDEMNIVGRVRGRWQRL